MSTITWLSIRPLDTIMVRDGRSFDAGDTAAATGVAPTPTTTGGVIGRLYGGEVGRLSGPVPALDDEPLFPTPIDLVRVDDDRGGRPARRLTLTERPDGETSDLDDRGPRLTHALAGSGVPLGGWVTKDAMAEWLSGETMPPGALIGATRLESIRRPPEELWVEERHRGIALKPETGVVEPGMLYSARHLRPTDGLTLLVRCDHDKPFPRTRAVLPLGGRGRGAEVTKIEAPKVFPEAPTDFPGGRLAVYLVSPALVNDVLWTPAGTTARLCALGLTGPATIATAPANFPRANSRLMWAVPAGSVFYLKFATESDATSWSAEFHGNLIPGVSRAENPVVTAGFGTCLTGRW